MKSSGIVLSVNISTEKGEKKVIHYAEIGKEEL